MLLKGLMARTEDSISQEDREARMKVIWDAMATTKQVGSQFKDWEIIAQAINYVLAFVKHHMPDDLELAEEQKQAARIIYEMSQRSPILLTDTEYEKVALICHYYDDILGVVTERELAGIELYINQECQAAKVKRQIESPRISRRSHRKPKKKSKK